MATTEAEYLAQWEEIRQGGDRWPPLHSRMGIEMVRLTPTTILSMELSDDVRGQVQGTVHGGILATFADVTAAVALWNSFDVASEAPVTTDLHVR
jgi:1,4-dihydroxy-2-naphthoyl-CoA hydrolase